MESSKNTGYEWWQPFLVKVFSMAKYGCLILISFFLFACSKSGSEVARVVSPDGKIDAVILESSGGATTSFWYNVCVVPHGTRCDIANSAVILYGASRNDSAYGVNMRWPSNKSLIVEYMRAKNVKIRHATIALGNNLVHVVLHSNVIDAAAPPGGMLYNKKGSSK